MECTMYLSPSLKSHLLQFSAGALVLQQMSKPNFGSGRKLGLDLKSSMEGAGYDILGI